MFDFGIIREFWRNRAGSFALQAGVLAPLILGLSAASIDLVSYTNQKAGLQDAVDDAAVASVYEAALDGWSEKRAVAIAQSILNSNIATKGDKKTQYKVSAKVDEENRRVTVQISQAHYPFFAARFMPDPQIVVSATATASGSRKICVVGLHKSKSATVALDQNAQLTAEGCSVHSNSTNATGLSAKSNAKIKAELICSAGGIQGGNINFDGQKLANCPKVDDPLAGRPAPSYGGCDFSNRIVTDQTITLYPGVYCGGLTINGSSVVQFAPGTYVMLKGPFIVDDNSKVTGKDVGFFFRGTDGSFRFLANADVELEGPETGNMAGLLFYQSRISGKQKTFMIESNHVRKLVGTIYLPQGILSIDADTPVADQSAYTAIIAKQVKLNSSPNLVLNTNYTATAVPVPPGIGGEDSVRLID